MVQLDSFRERIRSLENVNVIRRSVGLHYTLKDSMRVEPFLLGDVQRHRENGDIQPAVGLEPHCLD